MLEGSSVLTHEGRTMRKFAVLAVAAAALAFAASALAGSKTIAQSGGIVGDKAATVKLRVKVKKGVATKVSGFRANGVFTRCDGEIVRFKYNALDPFTVVNDKFNIKLVSGDAALKVKGKVKNNGNATKGSLSTNHFSAGGKTCKTPKQRFKTSR
jgi:hypothetical protein